jgi:hypothetical protein
MGLFVEMLQACIDKPADIAAVAGKNASGRTAGVPVKYQAPANLVGIDEAGGIMAVRFPLLKGSKLMIQHPFLHSVWDGNNVVQVTASAPGTSGGTDTWYARFEAVLPGMSKVKYWEKISKQLQAQGILPQAG